MKDSKDEKDEMFSNYDKFVNKIIAVFESVDFKKKTEWKLEHLKQKELTLIYMTDFRQIVFILNWDNKVYVSLFYWKLKDEIKNELVKIEWSDNLNKMIKIAVQINNHL